MRSKLPVFEYSTFHPFFPWCPIRLYSLIFRKLHFHFQTEVIYCATVALDLIQARFSISTSSLSNVSRILLTNSVGKHLKWSVVRNRKYSSKTSQRFESSSISYNFEASLLFSTLTCLVRENASIKAWWRSQGSNSPNAVWAFLSHSVLIFSSDREWSKGILPCRPTGTMPGTKPSFAVNPSNEAESVLNAAF